VDHQYSIPGPIISSVNAVIPNELYHPPSAMKAFLVVSTQNEILNPVLAISSAIAFM